MFIFYFLSEQHESLTHNFIEEKLRNYHFILLPNFYLLVQAIVTVCYISELNRVMIWFHANDKVNICKFYEDTIQDKIPLVLVSKDKPKSADKGTKDSTGSNENAF